MRQDTGTKHTVTTNTWKRRLLAVAAVALLSVPSAIGVQRALAPTRGELAAWLAAAGFEAVYISTAVLVLTADLRRYAQRVALAAVAVAVILNSIADYQARVSGGLASWPQFLRLFDPLALVLSLVESLPLAALAYAMATLLHRLSETQEASPQGAEPIPEPQALPAVSWTREAAPAVFEARSVEKAPGSTASGEKQEVGYTCDVCGANLPNHGSYLAMRRWKGCTNCRG